MLGTRHTTGKRIVRKRSLKAETIPESSFIREKRENGVGRLEVLEADCRLAHNLVQDAGRMRSDLQDLNLAFSTLAAKLSQVERMASRIIVKL